MTDGMYWVRFPAADAAAGLDHSPRAVARLLLQQLHVSDCNDTFARFHGFQSARECIGIPLRAFFPDSRQARSYLSALLGEGRAVQSVTRPGWGEILMVSHRVDEGGDPVGIVGVNVAIDAGDPSPRDAGDELTGAAVEEIGESIPGLLFGAIDQSWECMVLADLAGTIIYVNSAKAELMGMSREALIGTNLAAFSVPGQEELEREVEFTTLENGSWSGLLLRRRCDGKAIPCQIRTSLIRDDAGRPVAQLRIFHDASKQAQLEQELTSVSDRLQDVIARQVRDLANSSEGFRLLFENSPVATVVTSPAGTILEPNLAVCRLLKQEREGLLGMSLTDFLADGQADVERGVPAATGSPIGREEIEYYTGGGVVISVEQSSVAVGSGDDCVLVHFLKDTTQTRRLEREADAARKQVARADRLASIGQLVAGVAHELNNPLTGILSFAHMLRRDVAGGRTPVAEDIDTIVEAAERCRDIVRGLLDFSRQSESRRRPCELAPVLRSAFDLVRNQVLVKSIHAVLDVDTRLSPVVMDPHQIEQVVINLICNAIDAMEEGGSLRMSTRERAVEGRNWVEFAIQDSGCGIPEEALDRIFDPFYTTKPTGKGTGLGLAVSHGIVTEHGGVVEVTSQIGQGTTVTVRLPAATEAQTDGS